MPPTEAALERFAQLLDDGAVMQNVHTGTDNGIYFKQRALRYDYLDTHYCIDPTGQLVQKA